jgi:hypothetical protein
VSRFKAETETPIDLNVMVSILEDFLTITVNTTHGTLSRR